MVLLPLIVLRKEYRLKRGMLPIFLASGIVGAALALAQFGALILGASVAVVVLLLYTQPLWTTLFGRFFLQEMVTKHKVIAIALVILGVVFLVNPFDLTVDSFPGPMVALVGGIFLSAWVILSRVCGKNGYPPVTVQFSYTLFTLIFLSASFPLVTMLVDAPSITSFSFDLSIDLWIYLGGYAVVSHIIPQLLIFKGLKRVPASDAGILLLSEPVVAAILAYVFLRQMAAMNIILGGALILVSNYLVVRSKKD